MRKKILSSLLILSLPLCADQAVPPDEDEVIIPAEPVEYEPPQAEKKAPTSWKTAGMVLFTLVTLTAGIAVASSNNGSSV